MEKEKAFSNHVAFVRFYVRCILNKRLEQEKSVLDALLAWANETISKTAPKSALGKALYYLLEQWSLMRRCNFMKVLCKKNASVSCRETVLLPIGSQFAGTFLNVEDFCGNVIMAGDALTHLLAKQNHIIRKNALIMPVFAEGGMAENASLFMDHLCSLSFVSEIGWGHLVLTLK